MAHRPLKFFQVGSFAAGNRLLEEDERTVQADLQRTNTLTKAAIQGGVRDSSYGAIYFPWIAAFDPATNQNIFVPPSGHLAGLWARTDNERGVHKAPANDVLRGAVSLEINITKGENDLLKTETHQVSRSGPAIAQAGRRRGHPAPGRLRTLSDQAGYWRDGHC